jgi:hypothetical protein
MLTDAIASPRAAPLISSRSRPEGQAGQHSKSADTPCTRQLSWPSNLRLYSAAASRKRQSGLKELGAANNVALAQLGLDEGTMRRVPRLYHDLKLGCLHRR